MRTPSHRSTSYVVLCYSIRNKPVTGFNSGDRMSEGYSRMEAEGINTRQCFFFGYIMFSATYLCWPQETCEDFTKIMMYLDMASQRNS